MFRKTLSLVLLGILLTGSATVAYGTLFDKGFGASVAGVLGAGDDEQERGHDGRKGREEDEDHDD